MATARASPLPGDKGSAQPAAELGLSWDGGWTGLERSGESCPRVKAGETLLCASVSPPVEQTFPAFVWASVSPPVEQSCPACVQQLLQRPGHVRTEPHYLPLLGAEASHPFQI